MAAENVRIAAETVKALAAAVCEHDPRRKPARASDAMFALLTGTNFGCQCGRDDCTADIPTPAPGSLPPVTASIVLHVVCDDSTVNGSADHLGYLDGHGVISADHVRDIAQRADCRITPLVPVPDAGTQRAATGDTVLDPADTTDKSPNSTAETVISIRPPLALRTTQPPAEPPPAALRTTRPPKEPPPRTTQPPDELPPAALRTTQPPKEPPPAALRTTQPPKEPPPIPPLRAALPSDPYRPTAALTTYVHIRDGHCVVPGCDKPAWSCDLDHVTEYDHDNPAAGGQTAPDGLNNKCRFHHILKTHGDWLDDQYRDPGGRLRTSVTTPEGLIINGNPETLEELFPGLRRIHFHTTQIESMQKHATAAGARSITATGDPPRRTRTRLANKHARRRAERARNRRRREDAQAEDPPY
ncbi:hypothetical protein GCM10009624_09390 [Gordonia sinesedis]